MAKKKKITATPTFVWSGTDQKGNKREGEITSKSSALAKAELRKQGYRIKKIKAKPKPLFAPRKPPITALDIAIFSRQMATMMSSGVPLNTAIWPQNEKILSSILRYNFFNNSRSMKI